MDSPNDEDEDDDLVDRLLETNAEFRAMLTARENDPCIPIDEAIRRLEEE